MTLTVGPPQVWVADSGERSARGDARRGSRMGGPAESDGGPHGSCPVVVPCRFRFGLEGLAWCKRGLGDGV